ncbi:MAG: GNAT family N-acetyltransferase [Sphingobacteriia bacterium]|nr:GNAT family N-acetyltransferase [Sphingobacteriia bacterium]
MDLTFHSLQKQYLSLLLKWLETPHVKAFWDQDTTWTPALIEEKYGSYTENYKIDSNIKKPIHAFIVYQDNFPIGYIQYYNAYDFPREDGIELTDLPNSLAAFDIFIGNINYIGKGIGPEVIKILLKDYIWKEFNACFVDTESNNIAALKAYQKAGFQEIKRSTRE